MLSPLVTSYQLDVLFLSNSSCNLVYAVVTNSYQLYVHFSLQKWI